MHHSLHHARPFLHRCSFCAPSSSASHTSRSERPDSGARVAAKPQHAKKSGRSFADSDRRCGIWASIGGRTAVRVLTISERAAVAGELARRANRSGLFLPTRLAFATS
jgi:hypothetical protein